MVAYRKTSLKPKRVLLINAVKWSDAYSKDNPCCDVGHWFGRWLKHLPAVSQTVVDAEDEFMETVRNETDGVIISGSPRDAWNDDPVNEKLCNLIHECAERKIPVLGVCYGHQVMGRALGGQVGRHPQGLELGNTPIDLTPAGADFPLFAGFPKRFDVLNSHADAVLTLPPQCELLATGRFTEVQAFQQNGLLMGVQFHPESDPDTMRFIWSGRLEAWRKKVSFDLDQRLASLRPAPQATKVLENFVNHFIP
ncbi:MAG: type 1 glutamine amidotransferase [Verrucomicrobia bacterium]|nr:type 1 glutamine amidotransferase [Verrucomicrobiota bacterium]